MPSFLSWSPLLYVRRHLNFYRIHLLAFTITPLVFSGILYACNGHYEISYIDALFNCFSAMMVSGVASVDLSEMTATQQACLFVQMFLGSPVTVSWIIVYVRRHYFAQKFQHLIEQRLGPHAGRPKDAEGGLSWRSVLLHPFRRHAPRSPSEHSETSEDSHEGKKDSRPNLIKKLRTDMIRRMDDAPKLVNPSGWISEIASAASPSAPIPRVAVHADADDASARPVLTNQLVRSPDPTGNLLPALATVAEREAYVRDEFMSPAFAWKRPRRLSDPGASPHNSLSRESPSLPRFKTIHVGGVSSAKADAPTTLRLPRTQTVEFAVADAPRRPRANPNLRSHRTMSIGLEPRRPVSLDRDRATFDDPRDSFPRHPSLRARTLSMPTAGPGRERAKHRDFGGFPMPTTLVAHAFARLFPALSRRLTRTVTVPRTATFNSLRGAPSDGSGAPERAAAYISFTTLVGRNSAFPHLTNEQLEEIGGVEYRALNALLWLIAGYLFVIQVFAFIVIAPYMSTSRWRADLNPPALHRPVAPAWFALFQVVSAFTNGGLSLADQSMVPFQTAYPMVFLLMLAILAGNTCFPIFLRFTIWMISKLISKKSRLNETLHFLLDHPRRCFIYLFPSHQTWFLLTVVICLTFTDWFFFLVLDIGNPVVEVIPVGTRIAIGLFQATAVRTAGFAIVSLSALAPAVQVLYVVMMYVSAYPIAMSVRSTNVYEEQSLGIFERDESEEDFEPTGRRVEVWSRYLAMHVRRQLSFDMWWLGVALFLICIIERDRLNDADKASWFNIFSIVFELVSAYGTVGLSLGIPNVNYSFSGAWRPLSKLIMCVVMLRGRHRGLPVAIDRAVMLPSEYRSQRSEADEDELRATGFPRTRTRASHAGTATATASGTAYTAPRDPGIDGERPSVDRRAGGEKAGLLQLNK